MPLPDQQSPEYVVSVKTNDIEEAVASVASALYGLVEEALSLHENHEAEECEFEGFARDLLGVLTRHADQLAGSGPTWDTPEEGETVYG